MRRTYGKIKKIVSILCAVSILTGQINYVHADETDGRNLKQATISTIEKMPNVPSNFEVIDWKQRGIALDEFLFDYSATDLTNKTINSVNADRDYATIYKDDTYGGYMIPAFYGEDRPLNNANNQESIVVTSALISASLLGIDKNVTIPEAICGNGNNTYLKTLLGSDSDLTYLDSALKFYWTKEGANVFTNVPNGSDSLLQNMEGVYQAFGDYWYMLIANQNFFRLAALNPDWRPEKIKEIQKNVADKMCDMVDALGGKNCDFNIQGFDMINMKSVGTSWRQPDAAAGTANILYYAYKIFGTEKYLTYAKYCMDYLENLDYNPYYENMLIDASYVAAMMNAEVGTNYDVSRYLNWITGSSSVREWGEVNYTHNGIDVTGLSGNCNNDYAFFFNSIYPMTSILPTAKYDPSYAEMAGKWALNIANSVRYFLPDQLYANQQTNSEYKGKLEGDVLAYEGLKKISDSNDYGAESGTAMVGTGDAKCNATTGWQAGANVTNLGIYGSVYTGILGALIEETNVDNIFKLDCNKTDYYQENMYPTYLYYNPNSEAKQVEIELDSACDLYDSTTGKYIAKNVSGTQKIKILAESARVVVIAPANSTVQYDGNTTKINGVLVSHSDAEVLPNAGTNAVSSITVSGADEITEKEQSTSYSAIIAPSDVEDSRVRWSVVGIDGSETEKAEIGSNGTLKAKKNGQVVVMATAMDGSGVVGKKTVTISGQTLPSLSFNKNTATSTAQDGFGGNLAVDGDLKTRWIADSNENNPWISVDLEAKANISSVILSWEAARPSKYDIQISNDNSKWNTVKTIEEAGDSEAVVEVSLDNREARYVRVYTHSKSKWGCSLYELDVYGKYQIENTVNSIEVYSESSSNEITTKNKELQMYTTISPSNATDKRVEWYVYNEDGTETDLAEITAAGKLEPLKNGVVRVVAKAVDGSGVTGETLVVIKNQDIPNVALNKDVIVSNSEAVNTKYGINDGNTSTRWASGNTNADEWAIIDLGAYCDVNKVVLNWEAAYALKYKIQGSIDNNEYFDLVVEDNGQGGVKEHTFETQTIRYIKFQGVQNRSGLGYSLWEFEVYGNVTKPDTSKLNESIQIANAVYADNFTEESYEAMKEVLEQAQQLILREDITQSEVDEMRNLLSDAINKLEREGEQQMIGTVDMQGDENFDSDSLKNSDSDQWRWISYPESRMVMNYQARNTETAKYDGGMNLCMAVFVNGIEKKNQIHKFQMGPKDGEAGDYQSLNVAWYPYKLTADATYSKGKIHMDEFFADKDTYIRLFDITEAKDTKFRMTAQRDGMSISGNDLIFDEDNTWMVFKFLKLNDQGEVIGQYTPYISGNEWFVDATLDRDNVKMAFSMTLLPKNVNDNSKESTIKLASKTVGIGKNINSLLAATKKFWDDKLGNIPAPENFGFTGNESNGTISADKHRKSFYAAWTFQYQNIIEPTPEKGYNYYQVTLGKASTWGSGSVSAPNSCSWESLFNIQELSYVEPEIAWDAMKGFIYSIDDNGILDGECLPSQKAHTTWLCYMNMVKAFPEREEELKTELSSLYSYIYKYLMWRAENPRWIYGHENYPNEKDISFVTQWYSDVDYAIKIAEVIGKYNDVPTYERMKTEMGENSRKWFFAEYDTSQPDSKENRIKAFCFLNDDGTNSYSWPTSSHNAASDDALNYVYEALYADFPKDLTDKLVHSYLAFTNGHENEPLLGFQFYKYGDGCHTAYGLLEKELEYPELAGKWKDYINAVLANAIKNVDFAECLRVSGNSTHLEGVEPSSFTASAVIDYTYMMNNMRIDLGEAVSIGGDNLSKTDETDVDVYTLKGTKPELPKTVTVSNQGIEQEALVVWPEISESDYTGSKSEFTVEGTVYGTNIKSTATIHVHSGSVTVDRYYLTTVGKTVQPDSLVPVVYKDANNGQHHAVIEVDWETVNAGHVAKEGVVEIQGVAKFNNMNVIVKLVTGGQTIVSENELNKYDTIQLKLSNSFESSVTYSDVKWSVENAGNDALASISNNGTLLAVKAGTISVKAEAKTDSGDVVTAYKTITIKDRNIVSEAYGSNVTASSFDNDTTNPAYAVDVKENTWWRASNNDSNYHWFQMELNDYVPVSGMKIRWYQGTQPKSMVVYTSVDGVNWNRIYTRTSEISTGEENYSEIITLDCPIRAKYVRMETVEKGTYKAGIVEFEVYSKRSIDVPVTEIEVSSDTDQIIGKGDSLQMNALVYPEDASEKRVEWSVVDFSGDTTDKASITSNGILVANKNGSVIVRATSVDGGEVIGEKLITIKNQNMYNVALNKTASAGTNTENAWKAVDGDSNTRWGDSSYPQENWYQVNLGEKYDLYTFAINFETSHAKDFAIKVSDNGSDWQTIKTVKGNSNLNWRLTLDAPISASYVKIDVSKTSSEEWGFSIWEFEVYGQQESVSIHDDIAITGYQMTSTLNGVDGNMGFRVVYQSESEINNQSVEETGLIYGLEYGENPISKEDMVYGSNNEYVKSFVSTGKGKLANIVSDSNTASYYVMTMNCGGVYEGFDRNAYTTRYYVRAYAKLKNGEIKYSDVESFSIFNIADYIYKNQLTNQKATYDCLYNNILNYVDSSYKEGVFDWNNVVVKSE